MNRRVILPPAGYRESHARYLASRGELRIRDQRAMAYLAKKESQRADSWGCLVLDLILCLVGFVCASTHLHLFR